MFIIIDNDMKDELAGTTANVVLLKGNRIFCVSKKIDSVLPVYRNEEDIFFVIFWFIFSIALHTRIDILEYLNFSK